MGHLQDDDVKVPSEELTSDDRTALGWAVTTNHPVGGAIAARVRSGGVGTSVGELRQVRKDWEAAGRPAPQGHVHNRIVTFADGTNITAMSFLPGDPYRRKSSPDFGLYLDEAWQPPWPHQHFDWPDFAVPSDVEALRTVLVDVLERARRGDRVELGCLGGHGRTGTALGCLATLTGTPPSQAVAWVRTNYCEQAVETEEQERFVAGFTAGQSGVGRERHRRGRDL